MNALSPPVVRMLDIVESRSVRAAADFVLAELDAGQPSGGLVSDVLAPVQVEVGRRWQRNDYSVADEHAATAIVDNALATLAVTAPAPAGAPVGSVAVVCAEGDWHTLPARMAAELWRWDGWDVLYLGGSLPPADLASWLEDARPDVLAVTCSLPIFLPGVVRVAEVARDEGIACVAGGRGLGENDRRASRLGVRWAGSPAFLSAALEGRAPAPDAADLADRRRSAQRLEAVTDDLVEQAMRLLGDRLPAMRQFTSRQLASTARDYRYILQFLSAAVFADDPPLFGEFLGWLQEVLTSRGLPQTVLPKSVSALYDVLPLDFARARRVWNESEELAPAPL